MTQEEAIKIVRDKKEKRWIRFLDEVYLNEHSVKRLVEAAELLADRVEELENKMGFVSEMMDR